MKVHEYQARQILADAGVPVPPAEVIDAPDQAAAAYEKLGGGLCVVKAQVHAGGRGKGGGVKLVKSAEEAAEAATTIMSKNLVTHQTGPEGVPVNKLLVASGVDIAKEYYVGITLDRARNCAVLMASTEGGVEIEEVAEATPEKIIKEPIHPHLPLQPYQAREIALKLGFEGQAFKTACKVLIKLTEIFVQNDADLVEINPLVLTDQGEVLAIDAKMTFDDNALFRQKAIAEMHDPTEEAESELEAQKHHLSFIQLDGNIGCLVNGAGLAMSTMDIIKLHGGEPANFLDVGGGATEEAVTAAFRIILSDENVKGVLVNIFGGIMQCDKIARAIINAAAEVGFTVPLVVRLEGTNVEPARVLIEEAREKIPTMQTATDLTDAAKKVVAAVNG